MARFRFAGRAVGPPDRQQRAATSRSRAPWARAPPFAVRLPLPA